MIVAREPRTAAGGRDEGADTLRFKNRKKPTFILQPSCEDARPQARDKQDEARGHDVPSAKAVRGRDYRGLEGN